MPGLNSPPIAAHDALDDMQIPAMLAHAAAENVGAQLHIAVLGANDGNGDGTGDG